MALPFTHAHQGRLSPDKSRPGYIWGRCFIVSSSTRFLSIHVCMCIRVDRRFRGAFLKLRCVWDGRWPFFPPYTCSFFFFFWVNPVTNTPGNGRMAKERGFKKRKSFSWSVCSFYLSSALSRAILFFLFFIITASGGRRGLVSFFFRV